MENETQMLEDTLEALLDKHGVVRVAVALELVCMDKADHIRSNWGDKALAAEWTKADKAFHAVAFKFNKSIIG